MKSLLVRLSPALLRWHVLCALWAVWIAAAAAMVVFRAIKVSSIAQMFQFDDVPLLRFFDLQYPFVYWSTIGLGAVIAAALAWGARRSNPVAGRRVPWASAISAATLVALTGVACRYTTGEAGVDLVGAGPLDWLIVALSLSATWLLTAWMSTVRTQTAPKPRDEQPRERRWDVHVVSISVIYLLGCAAGIVYALRAHWRFWDPKQNGGYYYAQFFLPEELPTARLVLYSTSVLFVSLAAVAGCLGYAVLHIAVRPATPAAGSRAQEAANSRKLAWLLGCFWSFVAHVPWLSKLWPEIRAERGWIMPVALLAFTVAALTPLILVTLMMMARDFRATSRAGFLQPRRSELVFWALLLFPVYPVVRLFHPPWRWSRYALQMILAAGVIITGTWLVNKVDELFDFEDWRGMLRAGQLPFLQVFFALMAAGWVYLLAARLARAVARLPAIFLPRWASAGVWLRPLAAVGFLALAVSCAGLATWPFWGWQRVSRNVFARAVEFNNRHEFELLFLHWLFDWDRDGYSAVLHGADADDFDPDLQAGGIPRPQESAVPIDHFEVADAARAKASPNLVVLYLEGVVPRAISAYGKRKLPDGLVATPHIDAIAREGALFTQARCFYPSTWDAWFSVNAGRYIRVAEMDASRSFGDRYSRYNNLYKVLKLAGVTRWCHADTSAYPSLFVPPDLEKSAWMPQDEFDSSISAEEEERGLWRGDKRADRIIKFIDDIKPGEKFFICEHMSDTHFPWRRTPLERARELGFPNGLDIYEQDADLPRGGRDAKYSRYFQTITRMDAQVGIIVAALKRRKMYDNTMIVIVSDHGCQWWEHEHLYYVSHLYDPSLLVPLIIKAPGVPGGRTSGEPVTQQDIFATVMEIAGMRHVNPRDDFPLPCRSLLPLMRGDATPQELDGYRRRDMPLTTHYDQLGVICEFKNKLIFDRPSGTYLLFSLADDPQETRNLADDHPDLIEKLLGKLRRLLDENKAIIGQIER